MPRLPRGSLCWAERGRTWVAAVAKPQEREYLVTSGGLCSKAGVYGWGRWRFGDGLLLPTTEVFGWERKQLQGKAQARASEGVWDGGRVSYAWEPTRDARRGQGARGDACRTYEGGARGPRRAARGSPGRVLARLG